MYHPGLQGKTLHRTPSLHGHITREALMQGVDEKLSPQVSSPPSGPSVNLGFQSSIFDSHCHHHFDTDCSTTKHSLMGSRRCSIERSNAFTSIR